MDSPGSSIISSLGAGSGIDFVALASDLSAATYDFQRSNLEARNQALEARISSASLIRSALTDLAGALGDRVRNGDLAPRADISNPSVVSVATTSGLTPTGSYSLEVTQLAASQTLVSPAFSSASDLVGEGTLNIRFGTVDGATFTEDTSQSALAIAVDATDTLETLASKIASASGGSIAAYVAQGTSGAQLVLKGAEGAVNGFEIDGVSSAILTLAEPGDLSYLSWTPASDAGQLRSTAQDAIFTLDTVQQTSASNIVTGLPEGLTFTPQATNAGAPTSIAFTNDTSAISDVMSDFVAALNDLAGLLNEEAAALGGPLGADSGARELKRDLQNLTNQIVMPSAAQGEPSTLADLGLTINRDGTFTLDTERLEQTLAASPGGAAAMFTVGAFGVFATIDNLALDNTLSSDSGSLGGSLARFEDRIEANNEKLEAIAESQEQLRARLTRQFVAAEQQIASSQSTLTFLQQQIDVWSASN